MQSPWHQPDGTLAPGANHLFARLPADILLHLLSACEAQTVCALSCCSRGLSTLACDAALWGALLRARHTVLLGENDPYRAMLPSAALESRACRSPGASPSSGLTYAQLYATYEREWLSSGQAPRVDRRWWQLAWRRAFASQSESSKQWLLAMNVLRLAYSGHPLAATATVAALSAACCAATSVSVVAGSCLLDLVLGPGSAWTALSSSG